MNILFITSEAVPFVKTGGLADVAGALFSMTGSFGHNAFMFLPCYRRIKQNFSLKTEFSGLKARMGARTYYFDLYSSGRAFLVSNDYFFNRDGIYGESGVDYPDNAERFAFFCRAVLQALNLLDIKPDIMHLNDWQTGLIPFYQKEQGMLSKDIKSVFTIHNIGYQGSFGPGILPKIGIPERFFTIDGLEFYGKVSLLKAGIIYADKITTVSPSYEKEITATSLGYGFEGLLRAKGVKGILNGLDNQLWNPETDKKLTRNYNLHDMRGKAFCKDSFCSSSGLSDSSLPLVGMIGRLSYQKGFDIIAESIDEMVKLGINMAILGKGDVDIERKLKSMASDYPGNIYINIGFDEGLARNIYAGSDMFLMPSRYEPCGIAQMIAMRYGSIPIVRMSGGLSDTVSDFNTANPAGNGFVFKHPDKYSMLECIKRALCMFRN
ncbi:MAG TPA: glycogen synthase, partial [Nitrospirae bacterium]|nr:glycogen synthase [Nitrospirota bacterium]